MRHKFSKANWTERGGQKKAFLTFLNNIEDTNLQFHHWGMDTFKLQKMYLLPTLSQCLKYASFLFDIQSAFVKNVF